MAFPKKLMLAIHRASSYMAYGSTAEASWIYEKVQRPRTCLSAALNLLYWKRRIPRIHAVIALLIEPVFGCNLRCTYCPWALMKPRLDGIRPRLMSWETFCAAVDGAPDSVESIQLAGLGEPALHPRICEMIECVADRGKRAILFSNCTLLKDGFLERLAQTRLSVLTVSAEPDDETCRQYRGVNLEVIRRNVEAFRACKRPMTEVKLRIVAHPGNVARIGAVREAWGGVFDDIKVCPSFQFDQRRECSVVCMEPWRGNICVWTDGKVSPCCVDAHEDLIIGDVGEQSLCDIIGGQAYRDMLARFVCGDVPMRCVMCTDVKIEGVPSLIPSLSAKRRSMIADVPKTS